MNIGPDAPSSRFPSSAAPEQALGELARLLDLSRDAIVITDQSEQAIYWNRGAEELYGFSCQEALGAVPHTLLRTEFPGSFQQVREALNRAGQWEGELIHTTRTGSRVVTLSRWILDRDEQGRVKAILQTNTDITERKRAEDSARENEERFRTMADGLPLIVWVHGADGQQQFVNRTFCEFFGVSPEQMSGEAWQVLMHPDDAADYASEFAACVRERRPFHASVRVRRGDGQWRCIESWGRPRFSSSGEFLGFVGASADITERQAAENALFESEARLAVELAAMRRLHDLISRLYHCPDSAAALAEVLAASVEITDAQKGNAQVLHAGTGILEIVAQHGFDPEFIEGFRELSIEAQSACGRAVRERRRIIVEDVLTDPTFGPAMRAAAAPIYRALQSTPLISRTGDLLGVLSTHYIEPGRPPDRDLRLLDIYTRQAADFLESKQAEEALRHRAEQFRTLINQAPIGVYLVDADFRLAQVNPVALPVFGAIPDLIGRDFEEVVRRIWDQPFSEEVIRIFRQTLETGESHHERERGQVRADRALTEYYEWRTDRIALPDGRFGVVCYFSDISHQVLARKAIAESEERYRTLFNSIDEGFCILEVIFDDADRPIDYLYLEVNPGFERQTGIQNVVGKTVRELVPDIESSWMEIYGRVARTGEARRFVHHSEPLGRWFDLYAFRVGDPRDRKVAVLFNDITERKRAEDALAGAQKELARHAERLEQVVAERTERLRETVAELEFFSYTITHDMRAPLRAMQAFGEILREEFQNRLDEAGADYLRRIIEAAGRMDSLITDSLNYTKAVQSELTLEPLDPGRLLRGMVESYPQFQLPRAEIEIAPEFPLVLANQAGLTQCFSNLLSNAVKFVAPGRTPRVRLWAEDRGEDVRLWIEDNGIGVPEDQRERVFALFQRLSRDVEGTGVGLALVSKVIEKMRGRVGLEPSPGGGSLFWLELKRAQPER